MTPLWISIRRRGTGFRSLSLWLTVPFALSVFLLCCAALQLTAPVARAQGQDANKDTSKDAKELADLLNTLADIDMLRYLNPLKLTPVQIDQMINAITFAQSEYDRKITAMGASPLLKVADDIRTTKRQALAGGDIPKEFDDQIRKIEAAILKRRDQIDAQNISGLAASFKNTLTESQMKTAIKLTKDRQRELGRSTEGKDDQWLNAFVVNIVINNPRIVPLLKEMRTAAGTSQNGGAP